MGASHGDPLSSGPQLQSCLSPRRGGAGGEGQRLRCGEVRLPPTDGITCPLSHYAANRAATGLLDAVSEAGGTLGSKRESVPAEPGEARGAQVVPQAVTP